MPTAMVGLPTQCFSELHKPNNSGTPVMLETLVGILGAAVLAAFGWILQLGTRVTKLEAAQDGLEDLINTQFKSVNEWLARLEGKLDRMRL